MSSRRSRGHPTGRDPTKKVEASEAYVSAQQPPAPQEAWLPGPDAHPPGSRRPVAPSAQGTSSSDRLSPSPREGLSVEERLRRRADFQRCYRQGRRRHGELLVLHFAPNGLDFPRLGITATRKVGGSVIRHRLKRQVREVFRRWEGRWRLAQVDVVVHLRPIAGKSDFAELEADLRRALSRLPRRSETPT